MTRSVRVDGMFSMGSWLPWSTALLAVDDATELDFFDGDGSTKS